MTKRNGSENLTAVLSPQILDTHSRRDLIGKISMPGIGTHVTSEFDDQAVLLDGKRATSSTVCLGLGGLLEIFKVRTQQLSKVRRRSPSPRHGKDSAIRRRELADDRSGRRAQFVDHVCRHLCTAQAGIHVDLIGLHGGNVTTQCRECSRTAQRHTGNKSCAEVQTLEVVLRRKLQTAGRSS